MGQNLIWSLQVRYYCIQAILLYWKKERDPSWGEWTTTEHSTVLSSIHGQKTKQSPVQAPCQECPSRAGTFYPSSHLPNRNVRPRKHLWLVYPLWKRESEPTAWFRICQLKQPLRACSLWACAVHAPHGWSFSTVCVCLCVLYLPVCMR